MQDEVQTLYRKLADKNDYCIQLREQIESQKTTEKELKAKLNSMTDTEYKKLRIYTNHNILIDKF